jgi:hypothetical protein
MGIGALLGGEQVTANVIALLRPHLSTKGSIISLTAQKSFVRQTGVQNFCHSLFFWNNAPHSLQ